MMLCAALLPLFALFATTIAPNPPSAGGGSPDAAFGTNAARANLAAISFGRIAEKKSHDGRVRAVAQRLIADGARHERALVGILTADRVRVPSDVGGANLQAETTLQGMSGAAFDRAYLGSQRSADRSTIVLLRHEIAAGRDPKLVGYAKTTLPRIEDELTFLVGGARRGASPR
jgi:putative membrane protein